MLESPKASLKVTAALWPDFLGQNQCLDQEGSHMLCFSAVSPGLWNHGQQELGSCVLRVADKDLKKQNTASICLPFKGYLFSKKISEQCL